MNFEAFSIKGTQTGRLRSKSNSLQIKRERDAQLLSEAIGRRALASRDWAASLGLQHFGASREELAKIHAEHNKALYRLRAADKEVRSLTDIIEKRAVVTERP